VRLIDRQSELTRCFLALHLSQAVLCRLRGLSITAVSVGVVVVVVVGVFFAAVAGPFGGVAVSIIMFRGSIVHRMVKNMFRSSNGGAI